MTVVDRFERELPGLLEELYMGPTPPYRDDLLNLTAQTRQRPGWTIAERWIPMDTIAQRAALPSVPWRTIGAVALVVLLLAAATIFYAGSRQTRLPQPFGPAANGRVAYASNGDIYTTDPATGQALAIVTGPEVDQEPVWSLDGTLLAFERRIDGRSGRLFVVRPDGSSLRSITPDPMSKIETYAFSPDGRQVAVSYGSAKPTIAFANVDGSGFRVFDVGMPASFPAFRPPDGEQIAFIGNPSTNLDIDGLYVANIDGSGLRTIVDPSLSNTAELPRWSPDGTQLAYDVADFTVPEWTVTTHVVASDGTNDHVLPAPEGARWSGAPAWSNEGTRLALLGGYSVSSADDLVLAVVPADGSGVGVATERHALKGWPQAFEWSPDDSAILVAPITLPGGQAAQQVLMDPLTGSLREASWQTNSAPAWQRVAPPEP